jgi:copper transport protein
MTRPATTARAAPAPIRRAVGALITGGLLGLVLALSLAGPASAHAVLVRTDPSAGTVLLVAPAEIDLTFSESVRPVSGQVRVLGPNNARVDSGSPKTAGDVISIPLQQNVPRGTYLVTFRVISSDSHPVGGGFTFSVGAPSSNPPTATGSTRVDRAVAIAFGAARYLGYAGLVLIAGPVLFLNSLWPQRLSRRVPVRFAIAGLWAVTVSALAEMYLEVPYVTGGGLFSISASALIDALSDQFGAAHMIRLAAVTAGAVVLRQFLTERVPSAVDRAVGAILAVVVIGTWPLSGHPGASSVPVISVVADAAHLTAMSIWLGGLVMLGAVLLPKAEHRELRAVLPVWSSWAMIAVSVLVIAGTAQALVEIRSVGQLIGTTYGRLVVAKVALLAVVLAVALFSRLLVRRMRHEDVSASRLRRSVLTELAITAVVIGVAATLVQAPPARTAAVSTPTGPPSVTLSSNLYRLRVDLDPGTVGNNSFHFYAYTLDGAPQPVVEWRATAALPAQKIEPIPIPILPITSDHAVGEFTFSSAGQWELKYTLRLSDVDEATVVQQLTVR